MDVDMASNASGPAAQLSNRSAMELRDAPAPFNKSTADVILRSSDRCDFRVRRVILAEASPVFEGMFDLPQPPHQHESSVSGGAHRDGLPILVMQEDSRTLDVLLRICYPVMNPTFDSLEALSPVLAAAVKYAVDGAIATIRADLRKFMKQYPLRVFCLSMHHGFLEEAEEAAKASLTHTRRNLLAADTPELELVNGKVPLYLINYHQACADTLCVLKSRLPFVDHDDWAWFLCDEDEEVCPSDLTVNGPVFLGNGVVANPARWWSNYKVSAYDKLQSTPCGTTISGDTQLLALTLDDANKCPSCRYCAREQMGIFVKELAAYVDHQVSAVRFADFSPPHMKAALSQPGNQEQT
ncbi:hypothetical protein FOMPIDRAFT_134346 [Fomitopsis schrenkii]|uniref:BTB domain-containing protein n=1 Tax=Fomitopsis schrenkii TaxID=2126942 RepID=S8G4A4_FOMSC|nr:hypothetical protein FOMPIDRAFT_134346 [Fomitopsis schrenkii]